MKLPTLIFLLLGSVYVQAQDLNVLLLSGRNNHNWKETTPYLKSMFEGSGMYKVSITEAPDTLTSDDLKRFEAVVSNWSSFPDRSFRWPAETERALLDFIKDGGGFVTIHAATTAFYEWLDFKQITTGAWLDDTWHGKKCPAYVSVVNPDHPITSGVDNFVTYEELWVNAEINPDFKVLATAVNENVNNRGLAAQPVLSVRHYGKGRIVHTSLGHDARMMRNKGFETFVLRGTEWAATGRVEQEIPQGLLTYNFVPDDYKWDQSDSSITLLNGNRVVWQYNFREVHQKPHFHPVYLGRNNITCVSPDDHPWHAGQWFSWKYINEINYWEYVNKKEYRSEGVTEIQNIRFYPQTDFSAEIELDIVYHPVDGENVLSEKRKISISAPPSDGRLSMDYSFCFEALDDFVEISRTPLQDEANGKSWGGYGGLSLRFSQSFMNVVTHKSWKEETEHAVNGKWFYMGFTGIDGEQVGSQVLIAADSERDEAAWYVTKDEKFPFYYFGPAYLYYKPVGLHKGERLELKYRINHFSGEVSSDGLAKEYTEYINQLNN